MVWGVGEGQHCPCSAKYEYAVALEAAHEDFAERMELVQNARDALRYFLHSSNCSSDVGLDAGDLVDQARERLLRLESIRFEVITNVPGDVIVVKEDEEEEE